MLTKPQSSIFPPILNVHTGSSMGATAALQHATLGDRVIAFGPRVDLELTHGAYVPEVVRRGCRRALDASLQRMKGTADVKSLTHTHTVPCDCTPGTHTRRFISGQCVIYIHVNVYMYLSVFVLIVFSLLSVSLSVSS